MAYQGARGVNPEVLREQNEAFAPEPDLLVLLDITPQLGLDRIRTRGGGFVRGLREFEVA